LGGGPGGFWNRGLKEEWGLAPPGLALPIPCNRTVVGLRRRPGEMCGAKYIRTKTIVGPCKPEKPKKTSKKRKKKNPDVEDRRGFSRGRIIGGCRKKTWSYRIKGPRRIRRKARGFIKVPGSPSTEGNPLTMGKVLEKDFSVRKSQKVRRRNLKKSYL